MSDDPWSRPTHKDLQEILERIEKFTSENRRDVERLELSVPAEIVTARGNTVAAMTREISRTGIGMFHRGSVMPGEVTVKMASDTKTFEYRVVIEWCVPCDNGMFISGGRFVPKTASA
jgi:hypothetical protein